MTDIQIALALAAIEPGYWLGIEALPGVFLSDNGTLASAKSGTVRRLKGTVRGRYLAISAVPKGPYIHRTMCELFHGPRPTGQEVRHLDGNPLNNAARNLAWGTRSQNRADQFRHKTDPSGERNPMAKLTRDQVAQMRDARRTHGLTYREIGSAFGVSTMTAYRAVVGESWQTK